MSDQQLEALAAMPDPSLYAARYADEAEREYQPPASHTAPDLTPSPYPAHTCNPWSGAGAVTCPSPDHDHDHEACPPCACLE